MDFLSWNGFWSQTLILCLTGSSTRIWNQKQQCRCSGFKSMRMTAAVWRFFSSIFSEFSFLQKMDKNSKNTSTEFLFRLFAYLGFLFNDCNAILSFIFWNRKNDYLIFIEKNRWKKIVKLQWPFLVDLNPEFLHRCIVCPNYVHGCHI